MDVGLAVWSSLLLSSAQNKADAKAAKAATEWARERLDLSPNTIQNAYLETALVRFVYFVMLPTQNLSF